MGKLRDQIKDAAEAVGIDPALVEAVVQQESSGRADAFRFEPAYWNRYCQVPRWDGWDPRRVASSYGLMQVMYPTALDYGYVGEPEGLFDIRTNLSVGTKILKTLIDKYAGNVITALAAYNGGPGGIERPAPRAYALSVWKKYQNLK